MSIPNMNWKLLITHSDLPEPCFTDYPWIERDDSDSIPYTLQIICYYELLIQALNTILKCVNLLTSLLIVKGTVLFTFLSEGW